MTHRPLLLACILLAAALAGCAGGSDEQGDEPAAEIIETEDGTKIAADKGIVRGEVRNEAGFAIKGARVSILQTEFFADTDERGSFVFVNVTPGTHVVEVFADTFQPHEEEADVEAGQAAELTITLLPEQTAGAGYVPHIHDRWRGQDTYVLMDQPIDFAANDGGGDRPDAYYTTMNGVVRPNSWWPTDRWPIPILESPDEGPAIVLPGTAKMEITLTWDGATMHMDDLGLCYRSADPDESGCFDPSPSGTTHEIDVTPSMADSGHQLFSLWSLWAYRTDVRDGPSHSPAVTIGEVDVRIELTKGELFLEPPHRKFWDGNDSLVLRSADNTHAEGRCAVACASKPELRLDDEQIVPPGTTRMKVTLEWEFDGPGAEPIDHDWEVTFRTGDMNPQNTFYPDYKEIPATEGSAAERTKVYEFELEDGWTDAFYQTKSNWRFGLWNADFEKTDPDFNPRAITFTLEVVAYNDDV